MPVNSATTMIKSNSITFEFTETLKNLFPKDGNDFNVVANYQLDKVLKENQGKMNFTQLLRAMQGVFPSDLIRLLAERNNPISLTNETTLNQGNLIDGWHQAADKANLPSPHLANYEWRFTEESARKIVANIKALNKSDLKICCLGTPSVALELIKNGLGSNTTFLDINEPLKKLIERTFDESGIICKTYDAQNMPLREFTYAFDVVVTNPPWYLDYYELFISRAINFLKPNGGKIIIPLFPPLSRQKAIRDLESLHTFLEKSNCREMKSLGMVEFEMPEFEQAILEFNKIPIPETNWRNAELVELIFDSEKESLIMKNLKLEKRKWLRYVENKLAVAVVRPLPWLMQGNSEKKYSVETHVLPTISRHEIENIEIDMWDSNNCVTIFKEEK